MEAARVASPSWGPPPCPASRPLRVWQAAALAALLRGPASEFLASATPAAGKTTFGLLEERDAPLERAAASEGFVALFSSAALDDVIRPSTAAGNALHLFAEEQSPALATPAPVETVAAVPEQAPVPPAPEPAFRRRERLRERRAGLVSSVARARGQGHREVNAWANRAIGVAAVGNATADQLEQAIAVLARELRRR